MPLPAPRANVRLRGVATAGRNEPASSPFASPPPKSLPRNVLVPKSAPSQEPGPVASEAPPAPSERGPIVRLRTLLVLSLLGLAGFVLRPRVEAAWKLHASANALANYALCMVGPTGPALLRDNSPEFRLLVRRRLVSSEANERPFQDCAKLARDLTESAQAERAHRAPAWAFAEFGGAALDHGKPELTLVDLGVSSHHLADLARQAYPFVRGGYVKLVKPSIAAHEAMHPVETARPALGRGLPAWRAGYRAVGEVEGVPTVAFGRGATLNVFASSDAGLTFRPVPARGVESFAERCPAGDRSFSLALSGEARTLVAVSQGPDGPPQPSPIGSADAELLSLACDAKALVVALKTDSDKDPSLVVCPFRGRCIPMQLPRFPGVGIAPGKDLDLARVDGTTIVSVPMGGLVRVASTRDDGHSWTPFTLAYDDAAHADFRADVRVPTRLMTLGKRVLLHGAAQKPGQSYSVLVSDDFGASFRTPDAPVTPVAAK